MSEMIAGGVFQEIQRQAQEARRREQLALHRVEERLLVFLALDVVFAGRARFSRCGQRERFLAVEVMGAGAQVQREPSLAEAAVEAGDDTGPV